MVIIHLLCSHSQFWVAAAAAKSLQSCLTLCDPRDGSPPGSPVPGILQARTLEWVAISFSSTWKWKVKVKSLSRVQLFVTPWTAAYQASLPMGFSRQEYWSGVPLFWVGGLPFVDFFMDIGVLFPMHLFSWANEKLFDFEDIVLCLDTDKIFTFY